MERLCVDQPLLPGRYVTTPDRRFRR